MFNDDENDNPMLQLFGFGAKREPLTLASALKHLSEQKPTLYQDGVENTDYHPARVRERFVKQTGHEPDPEVALVYVLDPEDEKAEGRIPAPEQGVIAIVTSDQRGRSSAVLTIAQAVTFINQLQRAVNAASPAWAPYMDQE